ncbi:reticulon-like protein B11 [Asparagus officinalis]|uniref:reticulon-like protein B11 n=1 Tax=Asparagus officinalis TaxID=4686 RepID=UPI00098E4573|nr:reticulon-like protein B11 [Asparagus officinalis]
MLAGAGLPLRRKFLTDFVFAAARQAVSCRRTLAVDLSVVSLVANTLLLLVSIIFFWAKSATLLNRPLPPIPNLEISNEVVEKATERVRVWINRVLSVARDIGVGRDRKVFLQVIVGLWIVSYIGSLFSIFTLIYMGIVLALTVPVLYEKYQDRVDEKLGMAHKVLLKHYNNALSRSSSQANKKAQ